jgi:outer membrane protein, heavy metal efflux system
MRIIHKPTPSLVLLCAISLLGVAQAQAQRPIAAPVPMQPATQAPSQTVRKITLTEALAAATQNIDAKIAQQQWLSARADVVAANHAPLPTLSTSISQIDLQNGVGAGSWLGEKRVDKSIGIDWTWERGGKRALRTEAAKQSASASEQDVREILIQQKLAAQNAFFDLLAAQERIGQVTAIADSAKALSGAASKRLAAGDLSAQDAARSSIEAQRAQNDVTLAEQDRARAELVLNLVLDMGPQKLVAMRSGLGTSAGMDSRLRGNDKSGGLEAKSSAASSDSVIDNRPDVQAATARVLAAKAQLDNALALKSNDITLGTAIDHFPGTSNRLLMFRMQMPLQLGAVGGYSFQGEIDRASAQLAIAEAQLDRTRHAATNDELRLTQELTSNHTRAKSYTEGIAPAARRVADQAELAYNKGALSLTDLLEARRTWRATTLESIAAQTDFDKAHTAYLIRSESLK